LARAELAEGPTFLTPDVLPVDRPV